MYIKPKKIWFKQFQPEEVEAIFNLFKDNSPIQLKEWDKISFLKGVRKYGVFIHPETDKFDNSVGIKPKLLSKILRQLSLKDLETVIFFFNKKIENKEFVKNNTDSEGFIDWNNQLIEHLVIKENRVETLTSFIKSLFDSELDNDFIISSEVIEEILEKPYLIDFLTNKKIRASYVEGYNLTKDFFPKMREDKKRKWKEVSNFIPKSDILLMSNCMGIYPYQIKIVEEVFNGKLLSLPLNNQYAAVSMLHIMKKLEIKDKKDYLFNGKVFLDLTKELNISFIKDIDIEKFNINSIRDLLKTINDNKLSEKSREILKKEPKLLKFSSFYEELDKDLGIDSKDFIYNLDYIHISYIKRYMNGDISSLEELKSLYYIWGSRVSTTLPNIKGEIGEYQFEIIDTLTNKEALFAGYATDCCMTANGVGEECLRSGYNNNNESFFIVKKNKKIIAHSWLWKGIDSKGEDFIVFDSIELLGEINKRITIIDCYKYIFKELLKNFKYIAVSKCSAGKKVEDISSCLIKEDLLQERNIYHEDSCIYTDTTRKGVYIIDKESLKV